MKREDIFLAEMSLSKNKRWTKIERLAKTGLLHGFTNKLEIGGHDIYVQTSWWMGEIVRIDITLSRGGTCFDNIESKEANLLDISRFDSARCAIEEICVRASEMIQAGTVGIGHFVKSWMGREMYPAGICPQLNGVVKGPTDAVAKLINENIVEWTKEIKCREALENDAVIDS